MTPPSTPAAPPLGADELLELLEAEGVTHAVGLPDNDTAPLLDMLADHPRVRLVRVAREGEAFGVASGLWVGGATPIVVIQNTGLLASINCIKGIAMDAGIPTFMLVGLFSRDVTKTPSEDPKRVINRIGPTLDTWEIPWYPLEQPDQNANTVRFGIAPQLAALEALVHPTTAELETLGGLSRSGTLEILPPEAPLVLFSFGKNESLLV